MKRSLILFSLTVALLALSSPSTVNAQNALPISYQGLLNDSEGNPVADGTYIMNFSIWDDPTTGTQQWTETHSSVSVSNGVFNVMLGSVTPIPVDVLAAGTDTGNALWLEIRIGADPPITPRTLLGATPYSAIAQRLVGDIETSPGALTIGGAGSDGTLILRDSTGSTIVTLSDAGLTLQDFLSVKSPAGALFQAAAVYLIDTTADTVFRASTDGDLSVSGEITSGSSIHIRGSNGTTQLTNDIEATSPPVLNIIADQTNFTGNIGIGTTSPSFQLDIFEDINDEVTIRLKNPNAGSSSRERISFSDENGDIAFIQTTDDGASNSMEIKNNRPGAKIIIGTAGGTMTLANDGNVIIGTGTPNYKLDVRGTIGNNATLHHSDRRWKTDINSVTEALGTIQRLRGVTFSWRRDQFADMNFPEGRRYGLIAQEVEEVLPELVHTAKDGYKSVEYANLVAVLIEAIKELKTENSTKERHMADLQARLERLEKLVRMTLAAGDEYEKPDRKLVN